MTVHRKGDGKLCAKLRFYPSSSSTRVSVAAWSVPSCGRAPSMGSQYIQCACVASGVTDLHMGFVEGDDRRHSDKAAQSPFLNERVGLDLVKLLLGQIFKAAVVPAAALAEVGLLKAVVDGKGNGEQRGGTAGWSKRWQIPR